ncbi:MAG: MMPL family transporter [Erysipelotrichaceae bacterium]|nr:MMPL family transporter [Erysipelotrichaceae bacterium]
MKKLSSLIVKKRMMILIISLVLLIPSVLGYISTKINYDLLTYLPKEIDTMKGQDILKEDFNTGAFSMLVSENMKAKDVTALKEKIEEVPHVKDVIWYDSLLDPSVPMEMLPKDLYEAFNNGDATLLMILYDDTSSADGTMEAVREIRKIADERVFVSGMTAVLVDTQALSEAEAPLYVLLAVILCALTLMLAMDSWLIPFVFLASIGIAIIYNLGSNLFLGQISYVTKALAAVLQLGVTMDYSIFLWHSYEKYAENEDKEEAMAHAIEDTMSSVIGSSVTTIAGFIALCFMSFTLGLDLGIVMAKGVLLGVISCLTVLPAMILVFDKPLRKTAHKAFLPDLKGIGSFSIKHEKIVLILVALLLIPVVHGYRNTPVYYNLDSSLPRDLPSIVANEKLKEEFNMNSTHMLLMDADIEEKKVMEMADEMKKEDGVKFVLGLNTVKGPLIPDEFVPAKLKDALISENNQLLLIGSEYEVASEEVNEQVNRLTQIAKSYDPDSMLIGEAPCTKDLIEITDHDFNTVSTVSIGVIFLIIAIVFRSISLPALLVAVIEFGIMINMGIPAYTGSKIPFIASIVIGTIQLGSTVDYAILITTKYRRERTAGTPVKEAVRKAVDESAKSVMVSALAFFASTFGVGMYSNIDMISSLCTLMSRGALISMACVLLVLPSVLVVFDGIIMKTTLAQRG